jgi:hypothetical protein
METHLSNTTTRNISVACGGTVCGVLFVFVGFLFGLGVFWTIVSMDQSSLYGYILTIVALALCCIFFVVTGVAIFSSSCGWLRGYYRYQRFG